jgi:vacuolar-type H+-ATPase subunit E/Vma4
MALEDIVKKILDDASREREKITRLASEEARAIAEKAEEKGRLYYQERVRESASKIAQHYTTILVNEKIKARTQTLLEKQALLDAVFKEALAAVRAMHDEEYRALMAGLLTHFLRAVGPVKKIEFSSADARLMGQKACLHALHEILHAHHCAKAQICFEGDHEKGGFRMYADDFVVDATLETLFEELRGQLRQELAELLFT